MFLPESYTSPKSSSFYLKLQDGENRIRILSKPIFGWEEWIENKPVRYAFDSKPAKPFDKNKPIKHFWAFIVYNVTESKIQIMQITQASIRNAIEALTKDSDWGSPFGYDIKITRKGEGIDTEYAINPAPHKIVAQDILDAFKDRPILLDALFEGGDPFATGYEQYTPLMTSESTSVEKVKLSPSKISVDQSIELSELLYGCSDKTQEGFSGFLKTNFKIEKMYDLPEKEYASIKNMLTTRNTEYQKELLEIEMADRGVK